jgi:hypothetical protein
MAMAIDQPAVGTVDTPQTPVTASNLVSQIVDAPQVKPPPTGATASVPPLTAAGLDLIKLVLSLTAGSILLLTALLLLAECRGLARADYANRQGVAQAIGGSSSGDDGRLALLIAQLQRARSDSSWTMSASETTDAASSLKQLLDKTAATPAQRDALSHCLPLPAPVDPNRSTTLANCVATADALWPSMGNATERVKMIEELQKQSDDQRQAFRTFWLQVAQLILMNLFFPLLTALLGYIFGTQQGQKAA